MLLWLSCFLCPGDFLGPRTLPGTMLPGVATDHDCPLLQAQQQPSSDCAAIQPSAAIPKTPPASTRTHVQVSLLCIYHFELQMHSASGCPSSFAFFLASPALNSVLLRVGKKCLALCLWQNSEIMSGAPCCGPLCSGLHRQISHLDANICPCFPMQCINHIAAPYQLVALA